jgi:predicted nucleotidyltransferase component of viral defense system
MIGPYESPGAFRSALETRLRNSSLERGIDLERLRRETALERMLARLFVSDDPPWLLKGGYALELRLADRARSTLDLDISVPDPERLVLKTAAGK